MVLDGVSPLGTFIICVCPGYCHHKKKGEEYLRFSVVTRTGIEGNSSNGDTGSGDTGWYLPEISFTLKMLSMVVCPPAPGT